MTSLNDLIQPEIFNDELYYQIKQIVYKYNMMNIIEIGSSSGMGSTQAIVDGIKMSGLENGSRVFCLEVSRTRYNALIENHKENSFIIPYNYCSMGLDSYLDDKFIKNFYNNYKTNLNNYPLKIVLNWKEEEIDYIKRNRIPLYGIDNIIYHNDIRYFDLAIIDGSAFTGKSECLKLLYMSEWIILGDIDGIKNYFSDNILDGDKFTYKLVCRNLNFRNGYSIFKREKF